MQSAAPPVRAIQIISSPFVQFAKMEAAGGVVLLSCTVLALIWANSSWRNSYEQLLATQVSIGMGKLVLTETRLHWINDGLMALFFFLVGLEIKREILVGELSSLRRAALPVAAALGGMIVPASLYLLAARGHGLERGWAIAISTDTAFALGILASLGSRVPISLKVFVTALAIFDDIFAVIIIAVFYTNEINHISLFAGCGCIGLSFLANMLGVRNPLVYAVIGIFAWCAVLNSGVHATLAGILLAFTIPSDTALDKMQFLKQSRSLIDELEAAEPNGTEEHAILHTLHKNLIEAESPLHRIEQRLQPWVSFFVIPVFALANAGVNVSAYAAAAIKHPLSLGVALGFILGKPIGIWLFSMLAVRTGIALPLENIYSRQILGCGSLCGIGFTMALFVAELAFGEGDSLAVSKLAILGASFVSAMVGSVLLTQAAKPHGAQAAAAA
ncbi:MAG TPA: Na+/H+ antiporter NhaA [Terriglobales bacterium]|nr:Na+/H+ antiporter NhaA [Terriglobales bacterium]